MPNRSGFSELRVVIVLAALLIALPARADVQCNITAPTLEDLRARAQAVHEAQRRVPNRGRRFPRAAWMSVDELRASPALRTNPSARANGGALSWRRAHGSRGSASEPGPIRIDRHRAPRRADRRGIASLRGLGRGRRDRAMDTRDGSGVAGKRCRICERPDDSRRSPHRRQLRRHRVGVGRSNVDTIPRELIHPARVRDRPRQPHRRGRRHGWAVGQGPDVRRPAVDAARR